jgi:SAM-dependent methyltransferase
VQLEIAAPNLPPAASKWPKTFPPLTDEQKQISDDFMKYWHEVLPRRFGRIEKFNHGYPVRRAPAKFHRTLEIGAGLGEHLEHERLTPEQEKNYYAVELRPNMTAALQERFPRIKAITGDCQQRLDFPDGYFDRMLAVHVLEHLPNLPAAIREMHRLCDKQVGVFSVVIPCEGSPAYTLARRISAQRIFEKRYNQSYRWFIEREHINKPEEILEELAPYFTIEHRSFFPLPVPAVFCNLVIGLTLRPKPR